MDKRDVFYGALACVATSITLGGAAWMGYELGDIMEKGHIDSYALDVIAPVLVAGAGYFGSLYFYDSIQKKSPPRSIYEGGVICTSFGAFMFGFPIGLIEIDLLH